MFTVNGHLACTPFETTDTKVEVKGGLAMVKQRHELSKLRLVYPATIELVKGVTEDFAAGALVLIHGDACKHPFAKMVYELEKDKPFVLVPYNMVIGFGE